MSCLSTCCGDFASYIPMHVLFCSMSYFSINWNEPASWLHQASCDYICVEPSSACCVCFHFVSFLFLFKVRALWLRWCSALVMNVACFGGRRYCGNSTSYLSLHALCSCLLCLFFWESMSGAAPRYVDICMVNQEKQKRFMFSSLWYVQRRLCFFTPAAYCVFFSSFCVVCFLRCSALFECCVFKVTCCEGRRKILWRYHVTFSLVAAFLFNFRPYFSVYEVPCTMWIVIGQANEGKPKRDVLYFNVLTPACLAPFLW